jgi:2-polyprenyl-3-methyl-5-hydroxy-6-metoxy-1,4-benzoquinol methylase
MTTGTSKQPAINIDALPEAQQCELKFWRERWPYRDWSIPELQKLRHGDVEWFLTNLGFTKKDELSFVGFSGDVLEVGCGPLGFFELMRGVTVTAIDSLMRLYASEIPYSTLGPRGATTYVDKALSEITDRYRFVVCSNVLVHTPDWMEFLELLVSRVRPGGELLLVTDTRPRPVMADTQVFTHAQIRRALQWLGIKREIEFRVEEISNPVADFRVMARVEC